MKDTNTKAKIQTPKQRILEQTFWTINEWIQSWGWSNLVLTKKHSSRSSKSLQYRKYGLLSASTTLLSISWERQTHIPIMTLVGKGGGKKFGKREGGEQTNCHSSGAKYPSKGSDAKGIKGKNNQQSPPWGNNWSQTSNGRQPKKKKS